MDDWAFVCPMCLCVQSARDFYRADPDTFLTFDEVEKVLGFSCVGRYLGASSPRPTPDGAPCNWTLGGLFQTHKLVVAAPDGTEHPRFEPAPPEAAKQHMEKSK